MNEAVSEALAELIAMRASGEITPDELIAARDRLRQREENPPSGRSEPLWPVDDDAEASAKGAELKKDGADPATGRVKKSGKGGKVLLGLGALFLVMILLGSLADHTVYKRADYGAAWPYPGHDTATVRCEVKKFGTADRPLVTVELNGVVYGLNGAARGVGGYPDSSALESYDKSATASLRQKMIDEALAKLCRLRQ